MYKNYVLKTYSLFSNFFKFFSMFYFGIFFLLFLARLFNYYNTYFSAWDLYLYTNGRYHENWFIHYILTFNLPYLFYMLFNCWSPLLNYCLASLLLIWDFDKYHFFYEQSFSIFVSTWNNNSYGDTFIFYNLAEIRFFKFLAGINATFFTFDVSLFSVKNFFKMFCPHNFFSLFNFYFFNDYNTLMVVAGGLFLLSSVLSLFLLSYLGLYGVFIFNLVTIIIFWFSVFSRIYYFFVSGSSFKVVIGKWFTLWGNIVVPFELFIDSISYSYILLTLTIAVFVYIYIFSYFRYEPNVERLLLFINFFVISMILLVSSGNFFVLFLGWELIGLTSFFLINFWSSRIGTLKAAFKAYVFNKFSDVSLFIAVILSVLLINDVNINVFNTQIHLYQNYVIHFNSFELSYIELLSFFFLACAFIKSAQFGTHIWLPDSMEAPAPASALIHSATLVSAGVFLVLRFAPLFELSLYAYSVLAVIGSFTAFFGGCCAMYQSDVKRILAYSTISHCGFLMVTCVTRIPDLTIFYLYVHGFFKAAVFLCVGNIIRFSQNYQDFKKMGGFWKYLPFEAICAFICLINLSGLPFTLGFYIKHILLAYLNKDTYIYALMLGFVLGGALTGLIYSYRLYYYVFFDLKKAKKYVYIHSNRTDLKSIFYSNTTVASNIAISILILLGYLICIFMYVIIFSKISISEAFDIVSIHSSSQYNLLSPTLMFLNFASGLNWVVLQLIVLLSFSIWRYTYNFYTIYDTLFSLILFGVFFYINFFFLV